MALLSLQAPAAASSARGDPPAPPPAERLAELQTMLGSTGLSAERREAAAAEASALRRQLIAEAGPESLRAPTWALDQAAAELGAVGASAADLAVLFGLATDQQRQAVADAGAEARRLVREAEARIERLLADADAERLSGAEPDDARAQALRTLRDDEAGLRAPYYRGRAALLLAGASRQTGDEVGARGQGREALEAVAITEAIDPVAETARRVTGAVAALLAGEPGAARHVLEGIIRPGAGAPGPDEIDAHTHAEALFALATVRAREQGAEAGAQWLLDRLGGPPFVRAGVGDGGDASDPLLIVMAHDAAARLLIEGDARERAVGVAMRLLERRDLGLDLDQRRTLVAARVDRFLRDAPGDDFAPEVNALRAIHAARDPERRPEAIALLLRAADRTEDQELRQLARFEAAALLLGPQGDAGQRVRGVEILIAMLQETERWPRAAEAASAATAHARALLAATAGDPDRRELLQRALRAALGAASDADGADIWRLDLARVLVSAPAGSPVDPRWRPEDDRFAEALELLEAIEPASPAAADARSLAQALHLRAVEAARKAAGDHPGADLRIAEAAARKALEWARRQNSPLAGHFRLHLAEILLDRGDGSGAKAQLLAIADGGEGLPGGAARVRLNLARARLLSGGDAEAFGDLVDLAESLDAPPAGPPGAGATSSGARPEAFWEAWALILEILDRQNEGGGRSQVMRAHILRLRAIDPALGGAPWRERIEAVEERLDGGP